MTRMLTDAEDAYVNDLAAISGRLAAVVSWCITHDGETLADNPHQLARAKEALAAAHALNR